MPEESVNIGIEGEFGNVDKMLYLLSRTYYPDSQLFYW